MPFYKNINGYHPLVASFVDAAPENMQFTVPQDEGDIDARSFDRVIYESMRASAKVGATVGAPVLGAAGDLFLRDFLVSRGPVAQMYMENTVDDVDLVFHHTTPLHMGTLPYVLHLENITTLFFPFLEKRNHHEIDIRSEPCFELVKWQLESDQCRGIFSHTKGCCQRLIRCFNSEKITRKVRYIPLGVAPPPAFIPAIDRKFEEIPRRKGLNILFTNSAHQHDTNYFLRGGPDLLMAFGVLIRSVPDAKLTIVSTKPPDDCLAGFSMKNVEWMDQGIDDARLYELLLESDVFALPAAGLHSYSAVRAMSFGSVLICSDAPGYEEYVTDKETGFVASIATRGFYKEDPATGWMRQNFSSGTGVSPRMVVQLINLFEMLAAKPEERYRVALAARKHVESQHALGPWVKGIADLLTEAQRGVIQGASAATVIS
jgi:glycosyltransferase involved in cell wall biosynthesis